MKSNKTTDEKSSSRLDYFEREFEKIYAAERDIGITVDLILAAWRKFEAAWHDSQCDCRLNNKRDQSVETEDEAESVVFEIFRDLSRANCDSESISNTKEYVKYVTRDQWMTCCCENDEESLQCRHGNQNEQRAILILQEVHVNLPGKKWNSSSKES